MIDLVEIGYAIRWWAILTVIGVAAVPLGGWLFAPLADRGYAFSKNVRAAAEQLYFLAFGHAGRPQQFGRGYFDRRCHRWRFVVLGVPKNRWRNLELDPEKLAIRHIC